MIDSKPLKLISAHTGAVTFTFAGRSLGWANCTVNDHTGELHIMSDWGSWAYRWDPSSRSLGATDLTSFIASRDMPDYIANKLQREGRDASCLDVDETVRGMRRELCRQRRIDGRRSSIGGAGVGVDRMSKREARAIWTRSARPWTTTATMAPMPVRRSSGAR